MPFIRLNNTQPEVAETIDNLDDAAKEAALRLLEEAQPDEVPEDKPSENTLSAPVEQTGKKKKSAAAIKATHKWTKENYESYLVYFKKGDKSVVKDAAAAKGMSLNAYIIEAIAEKMEREKTPEE